VEKHIVILVVTNITICFCLTILLEKATRLSPHHMAQHHPAGSETTPPYAPRSSRFGSEPPSVEDDVDVRCYAILELNARNLELNARNDDDILLYQLLHVRLDFKEERYFYSSDSVTVPATQPTVSQHLKLQRQMT